MSDPKACLGVRNVQQSGLRSNELGPAGSSPQTPYRSDLGRLECVGVAKAGFGIGVLGYAHRVQLLPDSEWQDFRDQLSFCPVARLCTEKIDLK